MCGGRGRCRGDRVGARDPEASAGAPDSTGDPRPARRPRPCLRLRVLARRGLDAAALPDDVGVERPRNPEHGDYATNVALAHGQEGRGAAARPRRAGWPRSWRARTASRAPRSRARASSTCASPPTRRAASLADVLAGGASYGHGDDYAGPQRQPGVRLRQPDGPDAPRRHPLGRGRRRARPGPRRAGRQGRPRVLLQRRGRPDRPLRPLAGGRGPRRARRPRTATAATTSARSPPGSSRPSPMR